MCTPRAAHWYLPLNSMPFEFGLSRTPNFSQRCGIGNVSNAEGDAASERGGYGNLARHLYRNGGRGRNRTYNLSVKSRMLCQLSYASRGLETSCGGE